MTKLIAAFTADRSTKNAARLARYLDKHMMAECFAIGADALVIAEARAMLTAKAEG